MTTIERIKELREITGVSLSKCKEALQQSENDVQKAVEYLRKKGIATSNKKSDRKTAEGYIKTYESNECIAIIQINAETDFVVNNERFQNYIATLAAQLVEYPDITKEEFITKSYEAEPNLTIEEKRGVLIQALGENIQITRVLCFRKNHNSGYGIYCHTGNRIMTMIEIENAQNQQILLNGIALHIAAFRPLYISIDDIPQETLEKERDIAREQIKGKPEHIIENIVSGKIKAFAKDVCLLEQGFVKEPKKSVQQMITEATKDKNQLNTCKTMMYWTISDVES